MSGILTASKALHYARERQLDLKAARQRTDTTASSAAREAINKRDWALGQWREATGKPDPRDLTEEQIEEFLFPQKEHAK